DKSPRDFLSGPERVGSPFAVTRDLSGRPEQRQLETNRCVPDANRKVAELSAHPIAQVNRTAGVDVRSEGVAGTIESGCDRDCAGWCCDRTHTHPGKGRARQRQHQSVAPSSERKTL